VRSAQAGTNHRACLDYSGGVKTPARLAVSGQAPVEPIRLTQHKHICRRIEVERVAGVAE